MSVYGYCPLTGCDEPVVSRTRGIPTWDTCKAGHRFNAAQTITASRQSYVCGFMFDPLGALVVLVRKDRPKWQAGLLNGVGGKIEAGESPKIAMAREFQEETGVDTRAADWEEFATLKGPDFTVHMMRTFSDDWVKVMTQETEEVRWYPVSSIKAGVYPTVRNLGFLVPLALDKSGLRLPVELIDGVPDMANAA